MRVWGYRASNIWLKRQLDESWHRWLLRLAAASALAAVTLAALVGPRQTAIRLRYRIAQLGEDVGRLAQDHRRLRLEREVLISPRTLAAQLPQLGLAPLTPERVAFLSPEGVLITATVEGSADHTASAEVGGAR